MTAALGAVIGTLTGLAGIEKESDVFITIVLLSCIATILMCRKYLFTDSPNKNSLDKDSDFWI